MASGPIPLVSVLPLAAELFPGLLSVWDGGFSLDQLQELIGRWGYLVIFGAMLLENAGLPLPGETITLLGGYAAGSGQLELLGVIGAAAGGAILGDNLGYWVGRWAGWSLILRVGRLLRQSSDQMEKLREQFLRHANASVMMGRFVAVLRVIAGPMAGAVGMPYPSFLLCNFLGAILWASTMVTIAWVGGRWIPLERMLEGLAQFGLGVLILLGLVLLLPRLLSRLEARRLRRDHPGA